MLDALRMYDFGDGMVFEDTLEYRANSLWATSVHEAGHILIGLMIGFSMMGFDCEFLTDQGTHDAAVHWDKGHAYPDQMKALFAAGAAATTIFQGTFVPPFNTKLYLVGTLAGDLALASESFKRQVSMQEFLVEFRGFALYQLRPLEAGIVKVAEYIRDTGGDPDLTELERIAREVLNGR